MAEGKQIWIAAGYQNFALKGSSSLKIESLAKQVGKNKSSFYHYFTNTDIFIEALLLHHIEQAKIIAIKEQAAQRIHPDLIEILVEHKTDILFNKQLRISRDQKHFKNILDKTDAMLGNAFVLLWVKDLELKLTQHQLESLFELALENFYLQVTPENLTVQWLTDYFAYLKKIVLHFAIP